jgi:Domain of unknown function (DUF1772)
MSRDLDRGPMNTATVATALLWLLVVTLGISVGAGLYEARIELPRWLTYTDSAGYAWHAEEARAANTGLRFWVYVTTGPLTLLTLASLIVVWRTTGELRRWWLIALAVLLVERSMTFGFFIPTMFQLTNGSMPDAEAVATALRWQNLNVVRHVASGSAFLLMLKAFSVLYARRASSAV